MYGGLFALQHTGKIQYTKNLRGGVLGPLKFFMHEFFMYYIRFSQIVPPKIWVSWGFLCTEVPQTRDVLGVCSRISDKEHASDKLRIHSELMLAVLFCGCLLRTYKASWLSGEKLRVSKAEQEREREREIRDRKKSPPKKHVCALDATEWTRIHRACPYPNNLTRPTAEIVQECAGPICDALSCHPTWSGW